MSTNENSATVSPVPPGQDAASRDTVSFTFEGRTMQARVGDSVAVALIRNGVEILSHSVKYSRPRGLFCARGRCVTCLLEINREPGIKSCITPVEAGMNVPTGA